jgi:CHAT domain-containing protein
LKQRWWEIALEGYVPAIDAVEKTRLWAATDKDKQEIQAAALDIYQGAVQSCIELEQYGRALEFVERSKSRNLVEMLGTKDLYPRGDIPPQLKEELDRLRQEIRREGRRLEIEGEKRSNANLNALREQLERLVKQEIEPRDPKFPLTQGGEPFAEAAILQLLGDDPHRAIIQWYFSEDTLYTFLITTHPDTPIFSHQTPLQGALREFTAKYLQLYSENSSAWREALLELLKELQEILQIEAVLGKLFELAPECQELTLVPYRFLHIFPLHVLFPWERFPRGFSYSPSCQILSSLRSPQPEEREQSLAIQNPTQDLSYTDLEVDTIIAAQNLPSAVVLREKLATREAFTSQPLAEKNYLHLSCHGYFNFNVPLNSALLLAGCELPPPVPVDDTNRYLPLREGGAIDLSRCLTLGDIFELDLRRCHLVTLSACETGFSDIINSPNDEYIGLPAGFLYAGTPTVISTLWAVSDRATALLMIRFYQLYRDSKNALTYRCPRLALYHAQAWLRDTRARGFLAWAKGELLPSGTRRSLIAYFATIPETEQPFQEPHYWAAFTCVGL